MRRQAVEARALTAPCQLRSPQQGRSVTQTRGQAHNPGRRPAVEPPQTPGSGNGAGANGSRPSWEGTGTGEPGGRPEPQDQTKHFAAVETLHKAVE